MQTPIRLIIADDHAVFREGLKALLATYNRFKVVAEVERSGDLDAIVSNTPCDVVLLDLQMDQWVMNKIEGLSRHAIVVVLTASESPEDSAAALRLGARAVVQKRFALETLIAAMQAAVDGFVSSPPTSRAEFTERSGSGGASTGLTERESSIVRYVAEGLRNAEVAKLLSITEGTVKVQLNKIFHKIGVRDRVELAHYAYRKGLIKVDTRR
ncbi:MAG: response regulator transcription factor [Candidatus Binatus sp.]|uniref:response regulator transcription factor n=1 Tax=Candidatus Binatus sp. TaxID=2811406 RepID=UPI003BAF4A59